MQQRRAIAQEARQQTEAVCANDSLSPKQKGAEIHKIHQWVHQQVQSLFTPSQQEALRACQQERSRGEVPHPEPGHGRGPCGELATPHPHPSAEGEENEEPSTDQNQPHQEK